MGRLLLFVFFCTSAFGLGESPQGFTLDGRLYNSANGSNPLLDNSVSLRLQILDTNKNCILYEETQNISTSASNGYFNVVVGSGLNDVKRSNIDAGNYMASVFQNLASISGRSVANGATCSYVPTSGDQRYLRVVVLPSSTNVQVTLSPDMKMTSVPSALVAESLNGITSGNILQADSSTQLNQLSLSSVFSNTNYPKLTSLLAGGGNYVSSSPTIGASLPSYATSSPPTSPSAGSVWFDSTSGTVKYYNGSTTQVLSTASGSLSGDVTGSMGATTVAKVGGSTASNLHAAELLSNAATAVNTNSMIVKRDASGNFAASSVSTTSLVSRDSGSNTVTVQAPSTLSASYSLIWPTAAPTSNGQVLTSTTAGVLSWSIPYGDTNARAAISATAPLSYNSGTGVLALSGAANGDLSGNYPAPKVSGLQGIPVASSTPTIAGQVLRYDGSTQYAPKFLGIADLRSSLAGNAQLFPSTCTASQTLIYASVTDTFSCATISVSATNFASQAQNAILAGPSTGGAGAPTFRTLASSDLPVGAYDATYFKNGGNSFGAAASLGTADNFPLSLTANNNVGVTLLPSGNVGVGTTSPSGILDVEGGSAAANTNGTSISLIAQSASSGNTNGGNLTLSVGKGAGTGTNGQITLDGVVQTNNLVFGTYISKSTTAESAFSDLYYLSSFPVVSGNLIARDTYGSFNGGNQNSPNATMIGQKTVAASGGFGSPGVLIGISTQALSQMGNSGHNVSTAYGLKSNVSDSGYSSIGTGYAGYFDMSNSGSGITNGYGVYVGNIQATNKWSFYANDATAPSYFAGNVGIGTTSPSAALQIKAGTTAAGTAPLKFTSGPLMTSAEDGAIEYDGTNYYLTIGAARTAIPLSGGTGTYSTVGAGAGTSSAPSLTFSGDSNTGFYDSGSNDVIGVATGGINIFNLSSSGIISPTTGGADITSANGTAAAPTYSFAGDSGTGWFRPQASTLAASTGGVERLRVDSLGRVGVGTTTPQGIFDIQGGTAAAGVDGSNINLSAQNAGSGNQNGGSLILNPGANSGSGTYGAVGIGTAPPPWLGANGLYTLGQGYFGKVTVNTGPYAFGTASTAIYGNGNSSSSDYLSFVTNSLERLRVTSDGRVGIGTNNPLHNVDVVGLAPSIFFRDTSSNPSDTSSYGELTFGSTGQPLANTSIAAIRQPYMPDDNSNLVFRTSGVLNGYGGNLERMRIGFNGNVGIGTTAPDQLLTIKSSSQPMLHFQMPGVNDILLGSSAAPNYLFSFAGANDSILSGYNQWDIGTTGNFPLNLATGGVQRLTIDGTGNVGIGTTTPGAQLDVKGAIRISGSSSGYNGFQVAATAGSTIWTLPVNDGTANQVLTTNGSGVLAWSTPAAAAATPPSTALSSSATSPLNFDTTAGSAIEWSIGSQTNISINVLNLANGSSTTVAVRGAGVGTTTVNCYSDNGSTSLTTSMVPASSNRAAIASIFNIQRVGNYCYVAWSTGWP